MSPEVEFQEFPKIPRLSREVIITEKIDGTNACVYIGEDGTFLAGSRTRWITPEDDNYGFARWAHEHRDELLALGPGRHFGEWWGKGIQRNYAQTEKRLSLFNVTRWCLSSVEPAQLSSNDPKAAPKFQQRLPACVGLVPVLYRGDMEDRLVMKGVKSAIGTLQEHGSQAAPGFMQPEGIVVFHVASGHIFKKTLEKDEAPKSKAVRA